MGWAHGDTTTTTTYSPFNMFKSKDATTTTTSDSNQVLYGDCGACKSSKVCDYKTNCYKYSIIGREQEGCHKSECQWKNDMTDKKEPHRPNYIVLPLKKDCDLDFADAASHYGLYGELVHDVYVEINYDLALHDGRNYTREMWQPIYNKSFTVANQVGVKIPIEWDYSTSTYTFKVCFFGVDRFLAPGEVEIGWIFEGERPTKFPYGYACPSMTKIPDMCAEIAAHAAAAHSVELPKLDVPGIDPIDLLKHPNHFYNLYSDYSYYIIVGIVVMLLLNIIICGCVKCKKGTMKKQKGGSRYDKVISKDLESEVSDGTESEIDSDSDCEQLIE